MKKVLFIVFIMFFSFINAQNERNRNDSLVSISREKVELIMQELDVSSTVLIYSLEDKYYYIVTKDKCDYAERYVTVDSLGEIQKNRLIKTKRKDKKLLKLAFELDNYNKDLTVDVPNASYVRGKASYFVVKDEKGNRYGEYRLPVFSLPPPIDGHIYGYVVGKLSKEITKDKEASN